MRERDHKGLKQSAALTIDMEICKLYAEGCRKIVTAGLDEK